MMLALKGCLAWFCNRPNSGITLKSCHKLYENCWEIHLTVLFDGTLPVVETTAELKFKHRPLLPSIKLPVYAKVEKQ